MGRYLRMDENDDGTITITTNCVGEEMTVVVQITFDEIAANFVPSEMTEETQRLIESAVEIPNFVD